MKLEKVGMSQNCWDKSWDFQHFSWEIQRVGSSNTVPEGEEHRVERVGVEAADAHPDRREHHAARPRHDHLVGRPAELLPQGHVLQVDLHLGC